MTKKKEEVSMSNINLFRRVDMTEESTIFCKCGANFSWGGISDHLMPWVEKHLPHMTPPRNLPSRSQGGGREG
jgi:hypothetical protein